MQNDLYYNSFILKYIIDFQSMENSSFDNSSVGNFDTQNTQIYN